MSDIPGMKKDVQIGVRMSSEMRDKLKKLADTDKRALADYIRIVLEQHVARKVK